MLLRLPIGLASPGGTGARLSILIYHRVLPEPDPLFPEELDAARFETEMRWVRDWFTVLPLAQAVDRLYEGRLPARALAITFDDGYTDNEEVAAPILQRLGLTATFFISTGYWDGSCMWNDRLIEAIRASSRSELDLREQGLGLYRIDTLAARRDAIVTLRRDIKHLPQAQREAMTQAIVMASGESTAAPLMMSAAQVRRLHARGMQIGAHTMTHPVLTRIDAASARAEIANSKRQLEELLDEPVDLFAYPNGVPRQDYTAEHVRMVRDCGFQAAVSTAWGTASARSDRFQLPRFTPWDRSRWRYGVRLLSNLGRRQQLVA